MLYEEMNRLALLAAETLAFQGSVTFSLSGTLLLLIFMAIGGFVGYQRGIRAMLTVTLFTIIAYLICVRGGDQIVGVINRFYQNFPRLLAFATGREPGGVPLLEPLISPNFQVPLFFRVVLFIALVAFGFLFNKKPKWYAPGPNDKAEPYARLLGIFAGAFNALLFSNAATIFYLDYLNRGGSTQGVAAQVGNILGVLPDVSIFIPSLITIFFIILAVVVIFNLPKVWKSG